MKCGYRGCHNTAIGRLEKGGRVFIRCQYHENQYKNKNKSSSKTKNMKCNIKDCEKPAMGYQGKGKKTIFRCPKHQQSYLGWKTRREATVEKDESDMDTARNTPRAVREYQVQHTHGSKLAKNINARLDEIYG